MHSLQLLIPELILAGAACALFLVGFVQRDADGRVPAALAVGAALAAFLIAGAQFVGFADETVAPRALSAFDDAVRAGGTGLFVRMAGLGAGALALCLFWPTGPKGEGNVSLRLGGNAGELLALVLLSLCGLALACVSNDLVLLFLAVELASIPTYVLAALGRPLPQAPEAGVKYFFLGALAAAVLLLGLAWTYGAFGTTSLVEVALRSTPGALTDWATLAFVLITVGLSFKLAAFPLMNYAADVYQGAATPVTALIGVVPKFVGLAALLKIAWAFGGGSLDLPLTLDRLLWVTAAFTMTFGNVMALVQQNVKRLFAYSSIAHSGYLLAGVTAAVSAPTPQLRDAAVAATLFYLAAYGLMSTASFGVLSLLPARRPVLDAARQRAYLAPASGAETFDDLAGIGRVHPGLGACMTIACLSLIGIPLTAGFAGKLFIVNTALGQGGWLLALALILLVNSAVGAAYYLGVINALFFRPRAEVDVLDADLARDVARALDRVRGPKIAGVAVGVCAVGVLLFGVVVGGGTQALAAWATAGAKVEPDLPGRVAAVSSASR